MPLTRGQVEPLDAGTKPGEVIFRARTPDRSFLSTGSNALVLKNGDLIRDFLRMKNIQPPLGDQKKIELLIRPYLDRRSGRVKLGDNQRLILFELGTTDSTTPFRQAQGSFSSDRPEVCFDSSELYFQGIRSVDVAAVARPLKAARGVAVDIGGETPLRRF